MQLASTRQLAEQLMRENGLKVINSVQKDMAHSGWLFKFDGAVRRFGYCDYRNETISLSKRLTLLNEEAEVKDVILHEIAHALVGKGHGHGYVWKAKCREIGADPSRCYDSNKVNGVHKKWLAVCRNCDRGVERHRKFKTMACGSCCRKYSRGKYDPKYRFTWRLNK